MAESAVYSVSLLDAVDFAPETEKAEILQNVRTILSTRKGTVPLDRDFGLSWDYLDAPIQVSAMMLRAEIIQALAEYEPRVTVKSVDFTQDKTATMDGVLIPTVKVVLNIEDTSKVIEDIDIEEASDDTPYVIPDNPDTGFTVSVMALVNELEVQETVIVMALVNELEVTEDA